MPIKPTNNYSGGSASAEDGDQHLKGQDAASAELDRIESWTNPKFGGGGQQQAQLDNSYPYKERKPR
jgi:hypothetical protein